MSDYQGLIRVGIQGLGEIRQLNNELRTTAELFGNLENAQLIAGQIGQSAQRNLERARRRMEQAGDERRLASRSVENVSMRRDLETGRFVPGGGTLAARRLANRRLNLAERETREAARNLRSEEQNRRLISAQERRYAIAAGEAADAMAGISDNARQQQARFDQTMRNIGQGSRGNYLTNLFQGRQQELARGGGGRNLSPELQQQARNARAAWDLATAGGRENLQLMQRLATEMTGLVRQQNEFNRRRTGRVGAYEIGRRGQERITELSRMAGADPAVIRRLRSRATEVISTGFGGDTATSRLAALRMNAAIDRYRRELDAAAQELNQQRRTSFRNFNIRQNWRAISAEEQERVRAAQQAANDLYNRDRALSRDFGVNPAMTLRPAGMSDEQVARRNLISTRTAAAAGQSVFNAFSRQAGEINADMPTLKSIRRNQEKRAIAEARLAAIAEAEAAAREALFARIQKNIDLSQASRQASNFGLGFAGDPIAKSIRRNQEKRAIAEAKLAAIAEAEAAARAALFARVQKNIDFSQAGREASNFGFGLAGDAVAKSIRRNQEKRAKAEAKLAAIAEAEAQAREVLFARVQKNIDLSQAGRQASNFGFGSADDAVAKSIRRNREKTAQATAREAAAAAISANQSSARGRRAELRRTGGLSFEERLAAIRPDLAPGAAKPAPGFFRGDARKAIGEGLIGGAFPLLFGQGAGASAGGLAGGLAGGAIGGSFGFGLSLVGTAIGQAVDTTAQNLKDLAASLKSPNDTMAALEASGFRVGDSLKFQVEQLQSVGRAYDAQTLVLQEVERRLGTGAAKELNALNAEQKKLQDAWAILAGDLQRAVIPGIIGFTLVLKDVVDLVNSIRGGRDPNVDLDNRNYRFNPFTGKLSDIGERKRSGIGARVDRAIAGAPDRVAPSPQEAFAAEATRIEESHRIADQIQSAYREAFNLQRQAHDLQRDGADINREIADYSYRKQREIFDLRQQVAEKEIENNRAAAQNSIERGDLGARQTFAAAVGFEQQLLTNVRDVMRTRKEGEADIEQSRRRLELTMAKLNRDVEDYKRTTAREIEDIERRKLSYVRSVEDYKMRVADYVRDRTRESARLMRQAMTLPDVGAANGAMGGSGYFARLAELESSGGRNWTNPTSNARGFFQLIPKTENWLNSIGKGDLAARMLSRDLSTASQAAREFAILMRPAAKGLLEAEDVAGLDRLLNRIWTSLPGGAEAATGQRLARANALLTPRAGGSTDGAARLPGSISGRLDASGQNGADMPVGPNNEIRSYHTGVVTEINRAGNNGNYAVVQFMDDLGNRLEATYSHMAAIVKVGQQVTGGQVLGRYDASGRTSGPHNSIDINSPGTNGALQRNAETAAARRSADILVTGRVQGSNALQGAAAGQISNIPVPQFNPTPVGPTPSAAPVNAERLAVLTRATGNERDAQRILENEIKLRESGVRIGQLEQILQSNQLPQLKQQSDEIRRQTEARQQNLALSDQDASIADIKAEGEARIVQLLADRRSALQGVQKQYPKDIELLKLVNFQSAKAIEIAYEEEQQRLKNAKAINALQNEEASRTEILRLQQDLSVEKAEATALERGELQASNIELFKATALYEVLTDQQKQMAEGLIAQTEELRKQNEFKRRIAELDRDTNLIGAGLRTGRIGAEARAFEQGLRDFGGDIGKASEYADRTKLQEDRRMVWESLEKNIIDVSDAISGSLTNGLLDIISGAREIEDVGRDMLNGIARSFADSAQQQLTTLMQRQLAQFAGPKLAGMLGAGAEAAGPQALGLASMTAAGQVAAFGTMLQTVMAQMMLSGGMGGLGSGVISGIGDAFSSSAPSLLGSTLPTFVPGLSPTIFGGFFANGGTTRPGEMYVVGDGGEPEFFFPGTTGRVVPKSDMEKAAALREESEGDQGPIDVRYTVIEQAGQRYVTEEQFRKGMAETAKRAQAMTKAGFRNNKDDREYVGM